MPDTIVRGKLLWPYAISIGGMHVLALLAFVPWLFSWTGLIVMLLGVLGWAAPMRIVRGIVLSAKEREFVIAARSAGAGHVHILARHVLPQTTSVLLTQAALLIPAYMLAEVTLNVVKPSFSIRRWIRSIAAHQPNTTAARR